MNLEQRLKEEGKPAASRWEAFERWRSGERLFVLREQGGAPIEVCTYDEAEGYTAEQMLTLPTPLSQWRAEMMPRLAAHDLVADHSQVHRYPTVEALAEKAAGSRMWAMGETFAVCEDERFVIVHQLAPSSCEMAIVSHNGWHDVVTAYRVGAQEFAKQLGQVLEAPCRAANAVPAPKV